MVNGSSGSAAELHQVDPFQQDLFQEDQPTELRVEEPSDVASLQKEHSDQKDKEVNEKEEEEEKEAESPNSSEEEKPKPDALDDLYTSLASSDMYNSLATLAKAQDNTVKVINTLSSIVSPFSNVNPYKSLQIPFPSWFYM